MYTTQRIVNRSQYLYKNKSQLFFINISKPDTWQDRENKRNEWLFRTYWQCEETINRGGYVLFDTLSYDDAHLPHINDYFGKYHFKFWNIDSKTLENVVLKDNFSCFSHEDYRLFIVQLREELKRLGFNPQDNLKYFVSCEYGSDAIYRDDKGRIRKGTSRPHYHILFFVTDPELSPITLSQLINKCWHRGRTDGIDYKDTKYVLNHVFEANDLRKDNKKVRKVCNYVAKYVNKDGDWKKLIVNRLKRVFDELFAEVYVNPRTGKEEHEYTVWYKDPVLKKKFKKLVREIDVFHRQSQGFGLYALEAQDDDELENMLVTGMMSMPDDVKGRHGKHIIMPIYYQHKLFWEQYRDKNGQLRMRRNSEGQKFGYIRLNQNIDRMTVKMKEWYQNLSIILQYSKDSYQFDPFNTPQQQVLNLLGERSWRDYVIYRLVYEGRIRTEHSLETGELDSFELMCYNRFVAADIEVPYHYELAPEYGFFEGDGNMIIPQKKVYDRNDLWYNYNTPNAKEHFGRGFVHVRDLGCLAKGYDMYYGCYSSDTESYTGKEVKDTLGYITPLVFGLMYTYHENSNIEFKDFDKLTDLINRINEGYDEMKQKTYDEMQSLKKKYKDMGLYTKNI